MTRITKALTEAMQDNAVEKAGINKAMNDLDVRDNALTEAMRIESMGGKENLDRLINLNDQYVQLKKDAGKYFESSSRGNLINKNITLRVNLAGASVERKFKNGGNQEYRFCLDSRFAFPQGHPAVEEFYAIEDLRKELKERKAMIRAQVAAVVSKVTTVKRLLEVWPEAAELIPSNTSSNVSSFPAILTEDLNKLIGLPSDTSE